MPTEAERRKYRRRTEAECTAALMAILERPVDDNSVTCAPLPHRPPP